MNASRDVYLIKIPKMLIQPLVEKCGASWAGDEGGEGTVRVDVRAGRAGACGAGKDDGCGYLKRSRGTEMGDGVL